MENIATNKRAQFEYFVLERFNAGISLVGCEVKSIRQKNVSINESFITFRNGEAFIHNMFIKTFSQTKNFVPDERRTRKLLLNKKEILDLERKVQQKGLTCVPLRVYLDRQYVKLEIALCRGKLLHDKRESIKKRDTERNIQQRLKMQSHNT